MNCLYGKPIAEFADPTVLLALHLKHPLTRVPFIPTPVTGDPFFTDGPLKWLGTNVCAQELMRTATRKSYIRC